MFHADVRTDGNDDSNSTFHNFANMPKKASASGMNVYILLEPSRFHCAYWETQ